MSTGRGPVHAFMAQQIKEEKRFVLASDMSYQRDSDVLGDAPTWNESALYAIWLPRTGKILIAEPWSGRWNFQEEEPEKTSARTLFRLLDEPMACRKTWQDLVASQPEGDREGPELHFLEGSNIHGLRELLVSIQEHPAVRTELCLERAEALSEEACGAVVKKNRKPGP